MSTVKQLESRFQHYQQTSEGKYHISLAIKRWIDIPRSWKGSGRRTLLSEAEFSLSLVFDKNFSFLVKGAETPNIVTCLAKHLPTSVQSVLRKSMLTYFEQVIHLQGLTKSSGKATPMYAWRLISNLWIYTMQGYYKAEYSMYTKYSKDRKPNSF